ncbi:MAG: RNB domain-containing ribonuclease, partial [Pseudomonadota bacterium]|nr:RNB domain-containing ribonuclease [Pseudomonadota bacterium]
RLLIAEMMILANYIAAQYAHRHQLPIIYRIQEPPLEPMTDALIDDPLSFYKIRKLLRASTLSLQPGGHSGLGLSMYTQLSSPLRRFADLVMQRQLMAHLMDESLPYNQDELYKVLETAERTAREARLIEGEAKKRWFSYYLKQSPAEQTFDSLVIEGVKGGYRVELLPWGVDAFLSSTQTLEPGSTVTTVVDKVRVKAANIRLKLAS